MQLTIVNELSGDIYVFAVDPNSDTVKNLKALLEVQCGVPIAQQELFYQNFPMHDENLLQKYGVSEAELVVFKKKARHVIPSTSNIIPTSEHTQNPFQMLGSALNRGLSSQQRQQLPPQHPPTSSTTTTRESTNAGGTITEQQLFEIFGGIQSNPQLTRQQELEKKLRQNPYDVEAQKLLEEEIKRKNIEENYYASMEHTPESFFTVNMLYIPCKLNGHSLKAFVDSGAQMSICSKSCAEKCGLLRLMDTRFHGVAKGVGSCNILGRIHLTLLQLGGSTFPVTITVLDQGGMQFLLGLDMLKRHQMCIDLKENALKVGDEKIPFLPPNECPNEISDIESPKPTISDINRPNPFDMNQNTAEKETVIKQLMEMIGVDRQAAIRALELAKGNAELAASILFEQKDRK